MREVSNNFLNKYLRGKENDLKKDVRTLRNIMIYLIFSSIKISFYFILYKMYVRIVISIRLCHRYSLGQMYETLVMISYIFEIEWVF